MCQSTNALATSLLGGDKRNKAEVDLEGARRGICDDVQQEKKGERKRREG